MCAARRVNNTVGEQALGPRMTMGTNTAACAGERVDEKFSLTTSGCQTGGFIKRALKAWGKRCEDGTAGKSWSICHTGTWRGSKGGFLGTVGIYNREGQGAPIAPSPSRKIKLLRTLATLFFTDMDW
jgi:hypothetical protein